MDNKVKNANQRLKILYLYKILLERSDEEHSITMPEIISQLKLYGITAGRKALYEDIEALKTFGMDIVSERGHSAGYYVVNREFELPELKLLADAVSSSRFLTEKKSAELLKKLQQLTSVYEAKQIQRQFFVADRVKAFNERIYINVDTIHRAIAEQKKISFKYFDYDLKKQKKYRDGIRTCSPYAFAWDDERYYLVAYYEKYNSISNFRVDRMENIEILDDLSEKYPEGFKLSQYLKLSITLDTLTARIMKLSSDSQS